MRSKLFQHCSNCLILKVRRSVWTRWVVRKKPATLPVGAWLGSRTDLIVEQGGNYLVALKGNQGTLHQAAKDFFEDTLNDTKGTYLKPERASSFDVAHGREEERVCHVLKDLSQLLAADCSVESWRDLRCLIVIEASTVRQGKESFERRYYLSSGEWTASEALARVRAYWSIENQRPKPARC